MRKPTHYLLPEDLLRAFKGECAKEGRTMTAQITILIKKWLKSIWEAEY